MNNDRSCNGLGWFAAACVAMLVSVAVAAAADPPVEIMFRHVVIDDAGPIDMHTKATGDLNGDGFDDLIVAGAKGELVWYSYPDWKRRVISPNAGWSTDAELVDLDRDGDLDIVISDWYVNKRLVWFENFAGSGRHWRTHILGGPRAHDIEVADLDGDGDFDIVTRQQGADGNVVIVRVQKTLWAWEQREIACPAGEGLDVADMNGDGRPDVVIGGRWYQTPADLLTGEWAEHVYTTQWTHPACAVQVVDISKDGRPDVVLSPAEKRGGSYRIAWYESPTAATAAGLWTEHVIAPKVESVIHGLAAADMDGDGDVDVVASQMHQGADPDKVIVYRNQGKGLLWRPQTVALGGSHSIRVVDVGDDGDMDIFGANWSGSRQVDLWESRVAPEINRRGRNALSKWTYIHADDSRVGKAFGLAMFDFTGDGYGDIVSGRYFYRNPGADMSGAWQRSDLPGELDALLAFRADLDNTPDVIAMDTAGGVFWLEPTGNDVVAWTVRPIGNVGAADHKLSSQGAITAQLVAGGRPEVIINGAAGLYYFSVPDDPKADPWPKVTVTTDVYPEGVAAADVDGDGDLDLCGTSDGRTVVWWANPADGSGDWAANTVGELPDRYADRFGAGDVNGDGRVDIVVSAANGSANGVYWWAQGGPAETPTWTLHTLTTQDTTNSMEVVDLDNDGDLDIVAGEHRGSKSIAIWENDDGRGRFYKHVISTGIESHLGTRVADLDGDGDYDIVSIAWDKPEDLHIWRNDARMYAGPKDVVLVFDEEVYHPGNKRLFEDWDFTLGMLHEAGTPTNWLDPINFAEGTYLVRMEILEMTEVAQPVYLGFGWSNLPKAEDPSVQHRANKIIEATGPGVYYTTQVITHDWHGEGFPPYVPMGWLWNRAYRPKGFFTFIRPNGQDPFPIRFRLTVVAQSRKPSADPASVSDIEQIIATSRRRKAVTRGLSISPVGVLFEGALSEVDVTLTVHNQSAEAIKFVGVVKTPEGITASQSDYRLSGPAGARGETTIKLTADPPVTTGLLQKIELDWKATFAAAGEDDLTVEGTHTVHVEPVNDCPRSTGEITIDGVLDEWGDLPQAAASVGGEYAMLWSGPADASIRFATAHNDQWLYLAIKATDDEIATTPDEKYWMQDSIQVWLGEAGGPPKPTRRKVIGVIADGTIGELPDGAVAATKRTEDGYTVEIAIPVKYMDEIAGRPWRRFRLNVVQFDLDGADVTQLWWRNSWSSKAAYAGSGTFQRK